MNLEIMKDEYAQVHSSEKKVKREQRRSASAASKSIVAAKSAYKKDAQAVDAAKLAIMKEGAKAFKLYQNLLSNEAR